MLLGADEKGPPSDILYIRDLFIHYLTYIASADASMLRIHDVLFLSEKGTPPRSQSSVDLLLKISSRMLGLSRALAPTLPCLQGVAAQDKAFGGGEGKGEGM